MRGFIVLYKALIVNKNINASDARACTRLCVLCGVCLPLHCTLSEQAKRQTHMRAQTHLRAIFVQNANAQAAARALDFVIEIN